MIKKKALKKGIIITKRCQVGTEEKAFCQGGGGSSITTIKQNFPAIWKKGNKESSPSWADEKVYVKLGGGKRGRSI